MKREKRREKREERKEKREKRKEKREEGGIEFSEILFTLSSLLSPLSSLLFPLSSLLFTLSSFLSILHTPFLGQNKDQRIVSFSGLGDLFGFIGSPYSLNSLKTPKLFSAGLAGEILLHIRPTPPQLG